MEKNCLKSREKTFSNVSELLGKMNQILLLQGVKFGIRAEYAIEYLEQILKQYANATNLHPETVPRGHGHRKTTKLRLYDKLSEYIGKLKKYANHIKICREERNSYSKTGKDATFMRMKKDYTGNDQLLQWCNIYLGVCDEYIAVFDVKQYASDMDYKPREHMAASSGTNNTQERDKEG